MPKTKQEQEAEWRELYQKYKDNKEKDIVETEEKKKKESDEFEKLWIAAGHAVYDKSGNLLPNCKKGTKKKELI